MWRQIALWVSDSSSAAAVKLLWRTADSKAWRVRLRGIFRLIPEFHSCTEGFRILDCIDIPVD